MELHQNFDRVNLHLKKKEKEEFAEDERERGGVVCCVKKLRMKMAQGTGLGKKITFLQKIYFFFFP